MAEPATREELERLRREKRLQELDQKRFQTQKTPYQAYPEGTYAPGVAPPGQGGAIQGFATGVDRFVDSVENFDPQPDAGIKSPADAFLFKGVNALTGGGLQRGGNEAFEGTVQEGFGDRAVRASDSFPVGAMSGQITGMGAQLLPAQRAASVLKSVPGIKQATDLMGKTRVGAYAGRMAKDMAAWTGESAFQGATTLAEENSAYTGEKPSMASRAQLAGDMATMNLGDVGVETPFVKNVPINMLGPLGTSIANRAGVAARTGGASVTPKNVRQSVQESTGRISGGPEQMRSIAEVIDAELVGGLRPQAIAAVNRLLKSSGLTTDDIRALNTEVSDRIKTASGSAAGRKSVGQLYAEILEETKPQAAENVLATLRERRLNITGNDNSAGIIRSATRELRDSQKEYLTNSANRNLGDRTRIGVQEQVQAVQKDISGEYERILAAAPSTGPEADVLKELVKADQSKGSVLRRRAKNAGLSVDEYIDQQPFAAAHWLRSRLSKDAQSAAGREKGDLLDTVSQIDEVLDGFDQYATTKKNWGTEQGVLNAQKFGDKLFGGSQSNLLNNPGLRSELVRDFKSLTPREQEIALLSIRDQALGKMDGGPAGQQARLTALTSDAAIDFFEDIGAKPFSDDLMAIRNEQRHLNSFDPDQSSRTAPNQAAIGAAPDLYGSTASKAVRADGQGMGVIPVELAASQFAPGLSGWYAGYRGVKAAANKAFDLRNATKEDMTRFLMARPKPPAGHATPNALPPALPPPGSPTPSAAVAASQGKAAAGGYSAKDKAIDAGALGIATVPHTVGPADAQQASMDGELQAARERVVYVENEMVGGLEADLQMLNDPNADPKELQGILKRRVNPDLVIDGVVGPQTLTAINSMRGQLQGELETARGELDTARQRVLEAEQRQIFANNQTGGVMQTIQDQLPLVGTALGAVVGLRGRGGAVQKSKLAAQAVEEQANRLLNSKPIAPKSITGPNSLNERAANINEFWRMGGANGREPFKTKASTGEWTTKGKPADPSELFQASKNPFRTTDAGWIAGGLGEAALSTQYLNEAKASLEQAKADVEKYRLEGNNAGLEQAMAQVKQKEAEVAVLTGLQRLGLGVAAFRGMAALKSPYAAARPNIKGAEAEQALLRQKIRDNKAKPPGSASPD